jgi:asparagine synthase (glutamine-hydrolysing)
MCGITGEIRLDGRVPNLDAVSRMSAAMSARGPDAHGTHSHGRVAFGHRRLKIIDTSNRANQPLVDEDLRRAIVYNGAIYNYPELRLELTRLGHVFHTTGDTEVLLKGYAEWGEAMVGRLNGMFAFAIHDFESGDVFLARDRLGIKPLYLTESPACIRFASTLPALVAGGDVDTGIDPTALSFYMSWHAVVPAPHTILAGVRKLPPATTLTLHRDGRRTERKYWTLDFPADDAGLGLEETKARLLDQLDAAVRRRLVADVPVGVLLSGGLDSSLIVGLLARHGQTGLETFSIGFDAIDDEAGDEFRYSDLVASRFRTRHHQIRVPAERTLSNLEDCLRAMSEPMVSHDNIGFFLLSQEVRRHVKVVQSGQGADEVFGGYHWYPPMVTADADSQVDTYERAFFDRGDAELARAITPGMLRAGVARDYVRAHFDAPGATTPVDRALRLDTTGMLVDDPVKRVDNHTMASGLEARVPFLDHELVEFAATIPAKWKVRDGGKWILKEVARSIIPAEVIDRPKGYFPVPALKYLRGAYAERVHDTMGSRAARERGLFQADYVDELLGDPENHITPLGGSKLWQIAALESWLQLQSL